MNKMPVQDMPPPGGYPAVPTTRNLPTRGISGAAMWGIFFLTTSFGFYMVGQGNKERSLDRLETRRARLALVPMLQAEEDLRFVKEEIRRVKEEVRLTGRTTGNVYKTPGVWMPPSTRLY